MKRLLSILMQVGAIVSSTIALAGTVRAASAPPLDPKPAAKASPKIAPGRGPTWMALNRKSRELWVVNHHSGNVSVIDATRERVVAAVAVDPHPENLAIDAEAGTSRRRALCGVITGWETGADGKR